MEAVMFAILDKVDLKSLKRARKVYYGLDDYVYKLAAHEDEPDTLRIWQVIDYDKVAILMDDDASHLARPESEGIFEMRCDNMDLERRALMADLMVEFG